MVSPVALLQGTVLLIAVALNSVFNAYQLRQSSNIVNSFKNMVPSQCRVLRGGSWMTLDSAELQVGDICEIEMGQKVPADIRLIRSTELMVDKSMLTGESDPILCSVKATSRNILETRNMVFFGSMCCEGRGAGVVVHIGDDTVMGKISRLTGATSTKRTTLQVEVDRFVCIILVLILFTGTAAILTWAFWVRTSYPDYLTYQSLIANMCAFVVGYTPEGLPIAVTMTLTIVARRMAKHQVLVKDLRVIETFNTISLICSDKTGTLTINKMSVRTLCWGLALAQQRIVQASLATTTAADKEVTEHRDREVEDIELDMMVPSAERSPVATPLLSDLFECAALCNNAVKEVVEADHDHAATTRIKGDASDSALFVWAESVVEIARLRQTRPAVASLPFNSRNKYAISIHTVAAPSTAVAAAVAGAEVAQPDDRLHGAQLELFMKGAPEIILSRCSTMLDENGRTCAMTSEGRDAWLRTQEAIASRGERVLGFARLLLDPKEYPVGYAFRMGSAEPNYPTTGLTFLGLISLIDPARAEVPTALAKCRTAHIRVAMVTGDHPITGAAIAREIGLLSHPDCDTFVVRQDGIGMPRLVLQSNGVEVGTYVTSSVADSAADPTEVRPLFRDHAGEMVRLSHTHSGPYTSLLPRGVIVTGAHLLLFDDRMWTWLLRHEELVFARTTPEQKLKIVLEAQKRGEMVAVTGDGVNDGRKTRTRMGETSKVNELALTTPSLAPSLSVCLCAAPALRQANLGIAMNGGSEVAREAAHILLLDNNFNSIVVAIELGRAVFDNLKKVIIYLLPAGTWSEMLTILWTIFFGVQSMLSSFLMIVICTCTDVMVSVALVNETAEADIMTRRPRAKEERLVDAKLLCTAYFATGTIMFTAATINFFWYCSEQGLDFWGVFWAWSWSDGWHGIDSDRLGEIVNHGQCIFFVTLVIMQWGNVLSVRTRRVSLFQHNPLWGPHRNYYLPIGILLSFITLIVVTLGPFFQNTFLTRQVPIKYALVAVGWAVFLVAFDETRKYFVRNYPNSIVAKVAW